MGAALHNPLVQQSLLKYTCDYFSKIRNNKTLSLLKKNKAQNEFREIVLLVNMGIFATTFEERFLQVQVKPSRSGNQMINVTRFISNSRKINKNGLCVTWIQL